MEKEQKQKNSGLIALVICMILAAAIIVGCVFFSDEIFGLFIK